MNLQPLTIIKQAIRAVPAVKYALGVAGIVAAIAICGAFAILSRMSLQVVMFGVVIMLVFMATLVVFAKMTTTARQHFIIPALVLTWASLCLTIITAFSLFLSVFFRWPVDLQSWISPSGQPHLARFRTGDGLKLTAEGDTNVLSLYVPPTIASFNNDKGNQEIGSTVTQTVLTWVIGSGNVTTQWISHEIGSLSSGQRAVTQNASYSTERTWALFVSDGTSSTTVTTSVQFLRKRYWGVSAKTSLNDAEIISLSSELATNFSQSRKLPTSGEYIYFAWPADFGTAYFSVNGFVDNSWELTTRNFTNACEHTERYHLYRHTYPLNGTWFVETLQ